MKRLPTSLMACMGMLLLAGTGCNSTGNYDLLLKGGMVYDGSGGPPQIADIGIRGDSIAAIGDLGDAQAQRVLEVGGMAVSPGFIDLHTHLDPVMTHSDCESHLRQGVTTSLGGPDGSSPWPFDAYLDSLSNLGVGMNVGYLIGHNTVRRNVMGLDNRAPTPEELEQMKAQVALAMEEGAWGISTGLKYLPGSFSETEEVVALSRVASEAGGIYTSHLREEGLEIFASVQEAITISEQADITVVLTHHKVIGKPMWGKSRETLAMVDSARAKGLDVRIDQYPYNASYTGISVLIPAWARAGGQEAFLQRLADPILRDSIHAGVVFNILNDRGGDDLARIQFARVSWMPELEGKTLKYWCEQQGLEPTLENGADLVLDAQKRGGASCVFFAMDEGDVQQIMQHPYTMIASDGRLVNPGEGHPHPRWYGTFPRVLGKYVREEKRLPLETALYKMTGLPAHTMGLSDRGYLRVGMKADVTVFDPETVADRATFEKPHQYPDGIPYVIVNGHLAVDEGELVPAKNGRVLRKTKP
ncbi:D-aminoacylase [Robiginitalea sp. M366]|uniref:N-acyl-D-amino-acid deacylase family protein n=1 Tax=Robiginitalea aestuariiviva TaxID=3036903 RepID=UPI00240E657E|nr:D-aminoacylase [Robiginitalea aestuariiviva]MDG1571269.1 D-aminoacylase [Robiginitalea aestuariiviva]